MPCPRCGAPAGEPCETRYLYGARMHRLHLEARDPQPLSRSEMVFLGALALAFLLAFLYGISL